MSASGYTFFNKYTVVNDTITEGYSCQTFGISGFEPVCLKMSTDGSTYGNDTTGNVGILKALQSNSTFTGSCAFSSGFSLCDAGDLYVSAFSYGGVIAYDSNVHANCNATNAGSAYCYE